MKIRMSRKLLVVRFISLENGQRWAEIWAEYLEETIYVPFAEGSHQKMDDLVS